MVWRCRISGPNNPTQAALSISPSVPGNRFTVQHRPRRIAVAPKHRVTQFSEACLGFGGNAKWLSFAGRERATFLVYSLRSCTHAFPFRSLRYQVKGGRPRASGVAPQGAAPDATFKSKFAPPKDPKHQMLVEQDPSNHLTPRTRSALAAHRFPDLIGKSIWKSVVLSDVAGPLPNASGHLVDHAAVGDPGSERQVRRWTWPSSRRHHRLISFPCSCGQRWRTSAR